MKINIKNLFIFTIILIVEIIIALFIKNNFIRGFIGDVLVIVLMYYFTYIFVSKKIKLLPLLLFLFATFVELLQLIEIVELMHLKKNGILSTIIGTTFDFKDILCYFVGMVLLYIIEFIKVKNN